MVRSEIISKLSKRIHHKLQRKDLEKIFQITLDTIIQGIKNNILYIQSLNVRKSLAEISYSTCKFKPNNLIAVTGTNGKSSIADFYFQILKLNKKKVASIGTLGVKTVTKKKKYFKHHIGPNTTK